MKDMKSMKAASPLKARYLLFVDIHTLLVAPEPLFDRIMQQPVFF